MLPRSIRASISVLAVVLTACIAYVILPESMPEAAQRTAFIFVLAALLWATEIIPLHATSLLVVLLSIFLLCKPDGVLNLGPGGYKQFLIPFASPIIMLFFGGFVIAQALRKYSIDIKLAKRMLLVFGKSPFWIQFGFMTTTAFLSMWMSNTATTAMMIAMIMPFLRKLDDDDPFKISLPLSIAFGANIGGIGTPIGTPPNAVALGVLTDKGFHIPFLSWVLMALPLMIIIIIFISLLLRLMFRPKHKVFEFELKTSTPLGSSGIITLVITGCTILLWLTSGIHHLPVAVVSLLAVGLLTISGTIHKKDFGLLDWDILILMWGGLALGKAMELSDFTTIILDLPFFQQEGIVLLFAFAILAVFLSTVMSNTAAANLIIPIAISISSNNAIIYAIATSMACSFAMALPVSTPPNAMAFSTQAIPSKSLFKAGLIVSIVATTIMLAGVQCVVPLILMR